MNEKLKKYVDGLFPRAWTMILRNGEEEAYRAGYDDCARDVQRDLKKILEDTNA